ncbi:hypothetical protein J2Z32_002327 [Paenibacillus turicensis]|uniref:Phage protein n=1 Tax=Paenibacillus turicensis TaxID=160487 RepID=A0ABS4FSY9_9BACL|nr:hypothetical protein [Paenibacillus turicensis]MBP1905679.1 hypothetical protein [Paenibacillus turicensis]
MKKIDWKSLDIKPHNIVVAHTSEPDYEMQREMLLQYGYDTFIVLEGWHCSCYDFDETEWEAIEYTRDELKKLASAHFYKDTAFWKEVTKHI